jgi:hypothetical protein
MNDLDGFLLSDEEDEEDEPGVQEHTDPELQLQQSFKRAQESKLLIPCTL